MVVWGSQFPVAKNLLAHADPYTLTAVRFALAAVALVAVIALVEGRGSLRYEGRGRRAAIAGFTGYVMGVLFVYAGLEGTTTTSAAVVMATQPFITAIILRLFWGARLTRVTRVCMAAAFAGALLVVTRGDPGVLFDGTIGWGIGLVLLGQVGWVAYTIDSASFEGWSALRYTALTALPGTALLLLAAAVLWITGITSPEVGDLTAAPIGLLYSVLGPAFLSILAWNAARARLGAQSVALFPNLVPVITYGIEIARGYDVRPLEIAGAAIVIAALTASSLADARASAGARAVGTRTPAPEPV